MSNSDLFRDYLDERGYHYQEGTDDERGSRGFIAQQDIKGNQTLTIIFEFPEKETYVDVRIFDIAIIKDPSKREEVLELINELNLMFRFGKFFIRDSGDVVMQCSLFVKDYFDPEFVLNMAFLLIECIEEAYPRFMKIQWT